MGKQLPIGAWPSHGPCRLRAQSRRRHQRARRRQGVRGRERHRGALHHRPLLRDLRGAAPPGTRARHARGHVRPGGGGTRGLHLAAGLQADGGHHHDRGHRLRAIIGLSGRLARGAHEQLHLRSRAPGRPGRCSPSGSAASSSERSPNAA